MNLNEYTKGWIVGDFSPAILKSKDIEVGIKKYVAGDKEPKHVHKFVDEYTIVISGKIKMNDVEYSNNDIVLIEKTNYNTFECLEDATLVILKTPSIPTDKYLSINDGE